MGKISRLAGETVLYGFGSIVPRFLNFLLVRLHTGVFPPEEYGVITKLYAFVAVVFTVYLFGMETAYFRFASKPGANEKKVFNIALTVVVVVSGALSLIAIAFANPIAHYMDVPGRPDLIIWLVLVMLIDALAAIPFSRLRLQKRPVRFVTGKLINIGILVGLNVYFLTMSTALPLDVGLVVLANLLANAFFIVFFWRSFFGWRPMYDREISPAMFSYGWPVMLTGLAGITNEMFSRITLENWLPSGFYPGKTSSYALGVFGAAYKLAVLMNLAIQAFRYAAEPFFFSNASEKNSPQLFARVNHYFVIVCCIILLGVSVNLDILKYFLGSEDYWVGLHVVPILLLAYLFLGVYYNISVWFKLTDQTYYGTMITLVGVVVTFVANYYLIPVSGYVGSSIAALLCYFVMAVICYFMGQRFYPIPYKVFASMAYISVTLGIVYGVNEIEIDVQWMATAFHLLVCTVFIAIVYLIERKGLRA